jgi:hypothetical protein
VEEHVERWLREQSAPRGAVVPIRQVWELSRAWYADPRDPSWRRRTVAESQDVLTGIGLTGPFWQLEKSPPPH